MSPISKRTGGACLQEGRWLLQTTRSDNGFLDFVVSAKLVESRQINAQIRCVFKCNLPQFARQSYKHSEGKKGENQV